MYVSELDRPWVGSPFLFQGFVISSAEELEKLRQTCHYVFVDEAPSEDRSERTIRRSMNARPNGDVIQSRAEWQSIAPEERRITFRQNLDRANAVRQKARQYVDTMLADARFGHVIDTETAKVIVSEMVESVISDPDAALWLTQLKRANQYTAQHCVNVSVLAIAFAAHLGYSRELLKTIGLGALLHDVGKIYVPPSILEKPGRLSAAEYDIIKNHPIDGYEMLKNTSIPAQALQIVRFHHERLSGKGYPDGLAGDQIPTSVLITAICDVYDAITSDRVYRHGIAPDRGLQAMYQVAPSDFGRPLIHEFIRCVGIYPVGSIVELATGAIGVVMTKDPEYKLRPVVMLVRDRHGKDYYPRRFVSLSAQVTLDVKRDWSVVRVLEPRESGIDLNQIANDEILVGSQQVVHV